MKSGTTPVLWGLLLSQQLLEQPKNNKQMDLMSVSVIQEQAFPTPHYWGERGSTRSCLQKCKMICFATALGRKMEFSNLVVIKSIAAE